MWGIRVYEEEISVRERQLASATELNANFSFVFYLPDTKYATCKIYYYQIEALQAPDSINVVDHSSQISRGQGQQA